MVKKLFRLFWRLEKISPDQLALEFGVDSVAPGTPEAEAEVEEVVAPQKKRKHRPLAERIPDDLPVEEVVIEPAEVLPMGSGKRRIPYFDPMIKKIPPLPQSGPDNRRDAGKSVAP